MFDLIFKGIIIGILVSAPMGPIGMLTIQRTLKKGRWHGFITGLGATFSDVIYAIITSLGMGMVINFVETNQTPLQLIGSILLGAFGCYIFKSSPIDSYRKGGEKKRSYAQDFITAFFLTFSNMLIILLYIGLFARFGFILPEQPVWETLIGIGGIAIGATLWWFCITSILSMIKTYFNIRLIYYMNRSVGFIIIALSTIGIISIFVSHYMNLTFSL